MGEVEREGRKERGREEEGLREGQRERLRRVGERERMGEGKGHREEGKNLKGGERDKERDDRWQREDKRR